MDRGQRLKIKSIFPRVDGLKEANLMPDIRAKGTVRLAWCDCEMTFSYQGTKTLHL